MQRPVPAARLAEFHDVWASYLAKQLQGLSRAGLVRSVQGQSGGYLLTRAASEITVLDVVEAVDGDGRTFVCTEVRQRGPPAAGAAGCAARRAGGARRPRRRAPRPARGAGGGGGRAGGGGGVCAR